MENPYEAPRKSDGPSTYEAEMRARRGMVGHVRVLGVLMIVHGGLVLLFGLIMAFGAVMMALMPVIAADDFAQADGPPPKVVFGIIGIVYGVMAMVLLSVGGLQCYSGYRVWWFRGRTMCFVALGSGLLAALGCYCLPTAIALMVYGLIVMLDGAVREAFEYAEGGYAPEQIDVMFNSYAGGDNPFRSASS